MRISEGRAIIIVGEQRECRLEKGSVSRKSVVK